jgi:hypothetical protein
MPRGLRAQIPIEERVEEADNMEEDAPAPQQGGRRRFVVISQTKYDFLRGTNQRLERMEQRFAHMEQQFTTQGEMLKAILDRLPPAAGESSSVPHEELVVKGHKVWLKTLNLALMGGTPQLILLFLFFFLCLFILFYFYFCFCFPVLS